MEIGVTDTKSRNLMLIGFVAIVMMLVVPLAVTDWNEESSTIVADSNTVQNSGDLQTAFDNGGSILLGANIDLETITTSPFSIASGKTVILDLNGKTITAIFNNGGTGNIPLIQNNGNLTIT